MIQPSRVRRLLGLTLGLTSLGVAWLVVPGAWAASNAEVRFASQLAPAQTTPTATNTATPTAKATASITTTVTVTATISATPTITGTIPITSTVIGTPSETPTPTDTPFGALFPSATATRITFATSTRAALASPTAIATATPVIIRTVVVGPTPIPTPLLPQTGGKRGDHPPDPGTGGWVSMGLGLTLLVLGIVIAYRKRIFAQG